MTEIIEVWQYYLRTLDWRQALRAIKPLQTANGLVYELAAPGERTNESIALVDMTNLKASEPHYHPELEIYFVLQGLGITIIAGKEHRLEPNGALVIPSNKAHYTIPDGKLVLAVVNTPPFNPANYTAVYQDNESVQFNKNQYDVLLARNRFNVGNASRKNSSAF